MATKTKQKVISELKKEVADLISGKKSFKFVTPRMCFMMRPITKIYREGYVFNLRYCPKYDTPFVDEQPDEDVRLKTIDFEENELLVSPKDQALIYYLMLSDDNVRNGGDRYELEDKAKQAKSAYESIQLEDSARELVRSAEYTELQAAYFSIFRTDPDELSNIEMRVSLINQTKISPDSVIEAFEDKRVALRFKIQNALKLGIIYRSDNDQAMKWSGNNGVIHTVPAGTDIIEEFTTFLISEKGVPVLEKITDELSK